MQPGPDPIPRQKMLHNFSPFGRLAEYTEYLREK